MSVVGFDIGNFSSYVALVRSGGVDTVDNEYSDRATPSYISFNNSTRFCGSSAKNQIITNYKNTVCCFKNLLGLKYDDPVAQIEMSLSPTQFIKMEDGGIGVEVVYLGKNTKFTILQLITIMLVELKNVVLRHSPTVHDCVISVPSFYTDTQRRMLQSAASIAELKPLCIMNDTGAAALGYCLFKSDLPTNDQPSKNVAFVDMGYSQTQVFIGAFNRNKVTILSSVGTNAIGGRNFDQILFKKFSSEFQTKYKLDVKSNPKASVKLLQECESIKKKICTNSLELPLNIECFMDGVDVSSKISREEMEKLGSSIFDQLRELILSAIKNSKLNVSDIHSVEIIGGSTRIIGIRNFISSTFQKEVSTTVNADEIVARGCAVRCALLSPSVRIREIEVNDIITSSFILSYEAANKRKDVNLFLPGSVFPSTKEISLPNYDNFVYTVSQTSCFGVTDIIGAYSLSGKLSQECRADKLMISVRVDPSCMFVTKNAYFVENKPAEPIVKPEESNASTAEGNTQAVPEKPIEEIKVSEPKMMKIRHELNVQFACAHIENQLINSCAKLEKEMQNQIISEKRRSFHKNELEELIYTIRDKISSPLKEFLTDEEADQISQRVTSEEDWLYEEGENEDTSMFVTRIDALKSYLAEFDARVNTHSSVSANLDRFSIALARYRKLIDLYNADPTKYEHVTSEEQIKYGEQIAASDAFLLDAFNKFKSSAKTQMPLVKASTIEENYNKMINVCSPIQKKADNPPLKPVEVPVTTKCQEETKVDGGQDAVSPKSEAVDID